MNEIKFRQILLEKGVSLSKVAEMLSLSYQGLWKKMKQDSWTVADVKTLKRFLKLSDVDVKEIFDL